MPNALAYYQQGQQAVENRKRNALLDMQIADAPAQRERANRLADLQIANQQQTLETNKFELDAVRDKQAISQGIAAAGYVIDSKAPKREAEQRYPDLVAKMREQGIDWDALADDDVREIVSQYRNQLSAKAGIGPAAKLITRQGPDGQIIQENPVTGEIKQAVAPREDFRAKAEFSDKLARRRDAEQRNFTRERDRTNAQLQRELNEQRVRSKDEKQTDGQRLSAGFLLRMQDVEPSFGARTDVGYEAAYKPNTKDYVLFNKILKNEGGFFGSGTAAELNKKLSPEAQAYFQQATDWVRAKLRKESGAAIGAQEMLSEVSTYFPLPGDSQKTIEQKARSREVAIEAMRIAAGSANPGAPARSAPAAQPSAPTAAGDSPRVASEAEYNALPSGAQYVGPDGKLRQKR